MQNAIAAKLAASASSRCISTAMKTTAVRSAQAAAPGTTLHVYRRKRVTPAEDNSSVVGRHGSVHTNLATSAKQKPALRVMPGNFCRLAMSAVLPAARNTAVRIISTHGTDAKCTCGWVLARAVSRANAATCAPSLGGSGGIA